MFQADSIIGSALLHKSTMTGKPLGSGMLTDAGSGLQCLLLLVIAQWFIPELHSKEIEKPDSPLSPDEYTTVARSYGWTWHTSVVTALWQSSDCADGQS